VGEGEAGGAGRSRILEKVSLPPGKLRGGKSVLFLPSSDGTGPAKKKAGQLMAVQETQKPWEGGKDPGMDSNRGCRNMEGWISAVGVKRNRAVETKKSKKTRWQTNDW